MPQTFERPVIQIEMSELDLIRIKRFRVNSKPVILARDLDTNRYQVFDRLISPTVSKLELEGLTA